MQSEEQMDKRMVDAVFGSSHQGMTKSEQFWLFDDDAIVWVAVTYSKGGPEFSSAHVVLLGEEGKQTDLRLNTYSSSWWQPLEGEKLREAMDQVSGSLVQRMDAVLEAYNEV
jgi:hypothetical protein